MTLSDSKLSLATLAERFHSLTSNGSDQFKAKGSKHQNKILIIANISVRIICDHTESASAKMLFMGSKG